MYTVVHCPKVISVVGAHLFLASRRTSHELVLTIVSACCNVLVTYTRVMRGILISEREKLR